MSTLVPAVFLQRLHRFGAQVRVGDRELYVHVPDPGRLLELLYPGNTVLVDLSPRPGGRTAGRVLFAWAGERWVSVDAQVPTRVLARLLKERRLAPFASYTVVQPEVTYGESRLDFLLRDSVDGAPDCLVEVKSVTLVQEGVGLFPDAPTTRGVRHLRELRRAVAEDGYRAAVIFLVQREDVRVVRPFEANDPAFAAALREAARAGVGLHAYRCRVDPPRVEVLADDPLPVEW
ncbi:MAG: DNA/RNA nuclease SfsA [Bacillota bacterium]|nr:MAG: DNA/RNA nuclease SfsA [Bacillota bacterium]